MADGDAPTQAQRAGQAARSHAAYLGVPATPMLETLASLWLGGAALLMSLGGGRLMGRPPCSPKFVLDRLAAASWGGGGSITGQHGR